MSLGFFIEKVIDDTGERYYLYFDRIEEILFPWKETVAKGIRLESLIHKIKELSKIDKIERAQYKLPFRFAELSESEYKILKEKKGIREVVIDVRTKKRSSLKDLIVIYKGKEYKFEELYKNLLSGVASSVSEYAKRFGRFVRRDVIIDSFHSAIADFAEYVERGNIERIEYEDLFSLIRSLTNKYVMKEYRSEKKFKELLDKEKVGSGVVFEKKDSIDSMLIKDKLTVKYNYDEYTDIFLFGNAPSELKDIVRILLRIIEVLKK